MSIVEVCVGKWGHFAKIELIKRSLNEARKLGEIEQEIIYEERHRLNTEGDKKNPKMSLSNTRQSSMPATHAHEQRKIFHACIHVYVHVDVIDTHQHIWKYVYMYMYMYIKLFYRRTKANKIQG